MAEFKPVTLEEWPGLNLRDDPARVGLEGAVDLLNVDFDRPGRVRTRDGYVKFTASPTADYFLIAAPFYTSSGTKQIVVGENSGSLRAYNTSGVQVSSTGPFGGVASLARFGGTSGEYLYAANGVGTPKRWDGASWTTPAGFTSPVSITAMFLCVASTDNRLVCARDSANVSRVRFSDAGDPETFQTDNWVDLTPGDGEPIVGAVAWRDLVFVFKESRFFVFYGNSTDSTGGAVFNYRAVESGVGPVGVYAVTATPDGVYFLSRRGVYRTTGGQPVRVSEPIDPYLRAESLPLFDADPADQSTLQWSFLTYASGRLFLTVLTGATVSGGRAVFVYDLETRAWMRWDVPMLAVCEFRVESRPDVMFTYTAAVGDLGRMAPSYTTDDGTAITSHYRTGFFAPAGATVPSTIREVLLEGTGTVDVKSSVDYGDLGTASPVSLGVSPSIAQGRAVAANYGRFHSYEFSSTTGPFNLNRATFHLESKGPVGKQP